MHVGALQPYSHFDREFIPRYDRCVIAAVNLSQPDKNLGELETTMHRLRRQRIKDDTGSCNSKLRRLGVEKTTKNASSFYTYAKRMQHLMLNLHGHVEYPLYLSSGRSLACTFCNRRYCSSQTLRIHERTRCSKRKNAQTTKPSK